MQGVFHRNLLKPTWFIFADMLFSLLKLLIPTQNQVKLAFLNCCDKPATAEYHH